MEYSILIVCMITSVIIPFLTYKIGYLSGQKIVNDNNVSKVAKKEETEEEREYNRMLEGINNIIKY